MSPADIRRKAQEIVIFELQGKPSGHVHYARTSLSPKDQADAIAVHECAAELYAELIAAAPEVWAEKEADRG